MGRGHSGADHDAEFPHGQRIPVRRSSRTLIDNLLMTGFQGRLIALMIRASRSAASASGECCWIRRFSVGAAGIFRLSRLLDRREPEDAYKERFQALERLARRPGLSCRAPFTATLLAKRGRGEPPSQIPSPRASGPLRAQACLRLPRGASPMRTGEEPAAGGGVEGTKTKGFFHGLCIMAIGVLRLGAVR